MVPDAQTWLEPVAERRVAEVVEADLGRDLLEHAVDGRARLACHRTRELIFQSSKSPRASTVRAELVGIGGGGHEEELVGAGVARVVDCAAQRVGA